VLVWGVASLPQGKVLRLAKLQRVQLQQQQVTRAGQTGDWLRLLLLPATKTTKAQGKRRLLQMLPRMCNRWHPQQSQHQAPPSSSRSSSSSKRKARPQLLRKSCPPLQVLPSQQPLRGIQPTPRKVQLLVVTPLPQTPLPLPQPRLSHPLHLLVPQPCKLTLLQH